MQHKVIPNVAMERTPAQASSEGIGDDQIANRDFHWLIILKTAKESQNS